MNKEYQKFLNRKSQLSGNYGFDPIFMPDYLFDFQKYLIEWALKKGRGAVFADTGMGKTISQLVWAENIVRKTNKNILILAPLAVSSQTVLEAEKFGISIRRSRNGKIKEKITITNYQQLHKFDSNDFIGCACDEAGILKNFEGQTKKDIIRFMNKMPYRSLWTATPSPNDYTELGNSSECLGELKYMDMIDQFFRDTSNDKNPQWSTPHYVLKKHAVRNFWRWVVSWARALRKPSDLGFDDTKFILPPLIENEYILDVTKPLEGFLFATKARTLSQQREERKKTIDERTEKVRELCDNHNMSVIWAHYNYETDFLEKNIPDSLQISGKDSDEKKEEKFDLFLNKKIRRLIIKPKIGAWGLNWQHCNHMTFFPSHCFDEKTQILTNDGWKYFCDLKYENEIATINNNLELEYQYPNDIIYEKYEGDMLSFNSDRKNNKSYDLLVTPNHRMFVKKCEKRYRIKTDWKIIEANDLYNNYKKQKYRMLSCPKNYRGKYIDYIDIPFSKKICINNRTKIIDKIKSEDFIELVGWYLSEGYCGKRGDYIDGQITICQTWKNEDYRREIISLLKRLEIGCVYTKTKDIRIYSRQLAVFLCESFGMGSRKKYIPKWIKNLNKKLLFILFTTMLKGDGCSKIKGQKNCYRTASKKLADDFQEIVLKLGYRASVRYRGGKNDFYDVNIAMKYIEPYIYERPIIKKYNGMVGCVSVDNGVIIVRRNGIPIITGNSFEQFYQGVRRCWRFGQKRKVIVDIVSTLGEGRVMHNIKRKAKEAEEMFSMLVKFMSDELKLDRKEKFNKEMEIPKWLKIN